MACVREKVYLEGLIAGIFSRNTAVVSADTKRSAMALVVFVLLTLAASASTTRVLES